MIELIISIKDSKTMTSTSLNMALRQHSISPKENRRIAQALELIGNTNALKGRKLTYLNTEYHDVARLSALLHRMLVKDLTEAIISSDNQRVAKILTAIDVVFFELIDLKKVKELRAALDSLSNYYYKLIDDTGAKDFGEDLIAS